MELKLKSPVIITSRLLAGVRIGNGFVSIEYANRPGIDGRIRYRWYVDLEGGKEFSDDDLQSGCGGGSLQEGLGSLLSFLGAAGEAVDYATRTGGESDNAGLFETELSEWCSENSDEIGMAGVEIEESEGLIVEE